MGAGDDIIATGMARGAAARGKRIAFGDGKNLKWGPYSGMIFRGNPNIAFPGTERMDCVEWVKYYKGCRIYNTDGGGHWKWNLDFKCVPGQFFFSNKEIDFANGLSARAEKFVVIEPNLPKKRNSPNKAWHGYEVVSAELRLMGYSIVQFTYPGADKHLEGAFHVPTPDLRYAACVLKNADFYVGPEGGLHHAAAAVSTRAVVLFGSWIPPEVTGYSIHENLSTGSPYCGKHDACGHCASAMKSISVRRVLEAVEYIRAIHKEHVDA